MFPDEGPISPLLQKELDDRVAAASGDILAVRHELEEELHQLEAQQSASDTPQALQPDVALVLGEIEYLDQKLHEAQQPIVEKHPGLVERVRDLLARHSED